MKYIPFVNTKIGTRSVMRYSNGNTLPLVQMPFGMASFCPQSEIVHRMEGWFYSPDKPFLDGIRLTHQPSPWIGDYGAFLITPQSDIICDSAPLCGSGFRQGDSILRPDYLKIKFLRSQCNFELTPTERGCVIRLNYGGKQEPYLSFLPVIGNYTYEYRKDESLLIGTCDGHSQDVAKNFKSYIAVKFPDGCVDNELTRIVNTENGAVCHVALTEKAVEIKAAISYISEEMALRTLENETLPLTFDKARDLAESSWEEKLSRIKVSLENKKRAKTFYSCMYRAFLFPHKAYEIDKNGNAVHYSPCDGEVRRGVRYTDNGFWDTSRTAFPLYAIIAREEYKEFLEGFLNDYLEGGWLPRWISIGEVGCMPSTLIDSVIAEAVAHGIGDKKLWDGCLEGMLHHANNEGPERRYGRNGVLEYLKYGYVPKDKHKESVNLTLDAAYGDWCIAVVAKALGKNDIYDKYMKRSKNYANIFDKESGFMRGRYSNGEMDKEFDPFIWGGDYTEGSAWQNSFFVPHDIDGLCELYGGKDKLLSKLDELFAAPPVYRVHGYGCEIHEMSEMAAIDLGQCAISNQPSFSIPYLYGYLGEEKKCTELIKHICDTYFTPTEDGFPGDEDNGSMASWYILSALGIYPICPGKREYVHVTPLFDKIKVLNKDFMNNEF